MHTGFFTTIYSLRNLDFIKMWNWCFFELHSKGDELITFQSMTFHPPIYYILNTFWNHVMSLHFLSRIFLLYLCQSWTFSKSLYNIYKFFISNQVTCKIVSFWLKFRTHLVSLKLAYKINKCVTFLSGGVYIWYVVLHCL